MSRPTGWTGRYDVTSPRYVYLHIGANGEALYAGCSVNPQQRLRFHRSRAAWAHLIADVAVIGPFPPREALEIEREFIGELEPEFNIKGTTRDPRSRIARGVA